MIKQFHVEALGYEPRRMKPVHFANGFFRSVAGQYGNHLLLNKMAVIEGSGSLSTDEMIADEPHAAEYPIDSSLGRAKLSELRIHLNAAAVNDDAVYAVTSKTRFCDYTLTSARMLTNFTRTDGAAGEFICEVFRQTDEGKAILEYAQRLIARSETPVERFLAPLLDATDELNEGSSEEYQPPPTRVLKAIAKLMRSETRSIAQLVQNLEANASHYRQLRYLVIGLLTWLLAYLHRLSYDASGLGSDNAILLMDFSASRSRRMRMQSRLSFAQNREIFSLLYLSRLNNGKLDVEGDTASAFEKLKENEFRVLEAARVNDFETPPLGIY